MKNHLPIIENVAALTDYSTGYIKKVYTGKRKNAVISFALVRYRAKQEKLMRELQAELAAYKKVMDDFKAGRPVSERERETIEQNMTTLKGMYDANHPRKISIPQACNLFGVSQSFIRKRIGKELTKYGYTNGKKTRVLVDYHEVDALFKKEINQSSTN